MDFWHPSFPPWAYPVFFLTGLSAGLVDSMAGGGGLISLPVLLNFGLPVPLALGTNKFQSSFGSVSASIHYARSGVVSVRDCWFGVLLTLVGALAGAFVVQWMDTGLMGKAIPWLLVAIFVYSVLRPKLGQQEHPAKMGEKPFYLIFGLGLGFYDGFFGPGTGTFWTIALVLLLGQNFMVATGHTKVMNAASNLASLAWFAIGGQVLYAVGLTMALGQVLGARIGAGLVVSRGARFVRPVFLTMVSLTILRLLWVNYLR